MSDRTAEVVAVGLAAAQAVEVVRAACTTLASTGVHLDRALEINPALAPELAAMRDATLAAMDAGMRAVKFIDASLNATLDRLGADA